MSEEKPMEIGAAVYKCGCYISYPIERRLPHYCDASDVRTVRFIEHRVYESIQKELQEARAEIVNLKAQNEILSEALELFLISEKNEERLDLVDRETLKMLVLHGKNIAKETLETITKILEE